LTHEPQLGLKIAIPQFRYAIFAILYYVNYSSNSPSLLSIQIPLIITSTIKHTPCTHAMFEGPYDPFFGPRRPRIQRRQRSSYKAYTSSYEDGLTPDSSYEDIRTPALPPLIGPRITEIRLSSLSPLTDLPSRVNALSRRGATLSTYLAHLAAVMEPLSSKKAENVGERELMDILKEGRSLGEAMSEFGEQFEEVRELMKELLLKKREVFKRLEGDERLWKGKVWKDDF
jgi:hypothetical protein